MNSKLYLSGPEIIYNFLLAFSMAYYSKVKDINELKDQIPLLKIQKEDTKLSIMQKVISS